MSAVLSRVVVATKNLDKLREVIAVLDEAIPGVEVIDDARWPEVEETGDTLEENALLKARVVARITGTAAIADDTGLEVDALGGAPGVRTARFAGPNATYEENRRALLEALGDRADRAARFRTVVALVDPAGTETVVEGVLEGTITRSERGVEGFGYDSLFEVDGRTLAEIPSEEKNRMSHRALALRALVARLRPPVSGGGDGGHRPHL